MYQGKALEERDCSITVYPANVTADEILEQKPDMVYVSNGPGSPMDVPEAIETVKALIGKVGILGVGLGHQIICLALGAKVKKLKFGHHGANHPVKDVVDNKVFITSQNHNYVVYDLPDDVLETFINVNDGTCAGIEHKTLPVVSLQFRPDACDGSVDIDYVLSRFLKEDK